MYTSRLARQQNKNVDSRVIVRRIIHCDDKKTAFAISSVLQHCRMVDLRGQLLVKGDIGLEGWAALREALSCRLHDVPHLDTHLKINLASARKEDLRAIWECLSLSWKSSGDQLKFEKQRGEEGWNALERFSDLTNEEWKARKRAILRVKPEDLFVNGEQWHLPLTSLAAGQQVVVHLGYTEVEVEMEKPGSHGLVQAMQQAVLFHPAFGQQPELDQVEAGQAGQVDQVEDLDEVEQAALVQDEVGQAAAMLQH